MVILSVLFTVRRMHLSAGIAGVPSLVRCAFFGAVCLMALAVGCMVCRWLAHWQPVTCVVLDPAELCNGQNRYSCFASCPLYYAMDLEMRIVILLLVSSLPGRMLGA